MSDKFKVVREDNDRFRVETPGREKIIGRIKTVPRATHKYQLTDYPKHTLYTKFLHLPTAVQHVIDSHLKGERKKKKWSWFLSGKKKGPTEAPEYKHIKPDGSDDEHLPHENIEKTRGHAVPDGIHPHEHIHVAADNLREKVWGAASHPHTDQEALLQVSKAHAQFRKTLDQHMPRKPKP